MLKNLHSLAQPKAAFIYKFHLAFYTLCKSQKLWICKNIFLLSFLHPDLYLNYYWVAGWQNQQSECAPSEDSDQPGHLIRVFAVRMKKAWVLSYPLSAQRRLIRLSGCPGWSESSLGAQSRWFCHEASVIPFMPRVLFLGPRQTV